MGANFNSKWALLTLLALAEKELRTRQQPASAIITYLKSAKLSATSDEDAQALDEMIGRAMETVR